MQCSRLAAAGCLVTLIGSAALSAQAPMPPPERPAAAEAARLLKQPPAPIDPAFGQRLADELRNLSRLAAQMRPDGGTALRQKAPTPTLAPRQICGTKVLRPHPTLDPTFEVPLRETSTQFTTRTIPVLCR